MKDMRRFMITLTLTVEVGDDVSDDDLEDEIAYQVEHYSDQAIMISYTELEKGL
jgi:hypothetical protein